MLRRLRLDLLPRYDVSAEADLWFGPLVQTHSTNGIVLWPEAKRLLQARLQSRPLSERQPLLDAIWQIIAEVQGGGSVALLSEARLTWLALKGLDLHEHAAEAQAELRRLVATLRSETLGDGLSQWGERALLQLPEVLFNRFPDETEALIVGIVRRTGSARVLSRLRHQMRVGSYDWMGGDRVAERSVSVRLVEGGLEFAQGSISTFDKSGRWHEIRIPRLEPTTFELRWTGVDGKSVGRLLQLNASFEFVQLSALSVTLHNPGGDTFLLSPAEIEQPIEQHKIMGATPHPGGVTFRVWAPHAQSVSVAGTFNNWDPNDAQLMQEGGGIWSAIVAHATIGDQYKFVIANASLPAPLWKNDPYALSMTNSAGNSIISSTDFSWQAQGYSVPPWNEMVIYELHVGSFLFDPASLSGRGDFNTVIGKLGYLADLGINTIQVMPSDEFPGNNSMGNNPADIFAIEDNYGGPNGFQALVDAAHSHGIAVIYDVVYDHLGPNDLDLWQFDGWSENGAGGIYFYNDWRRSTPWGDTRPDYGREQVRKFLCDNALFWLQQHRCDGLRFHATNYIRNVWGSNNDGGSDLAEGWSSDAMDQ